MSFAVSIKGPMKTRAMEPHDPDVTTASTFQSTGEKQSSWRHHRQTETTQGNVWAGEETAALLESVNQPNKLPYEVGDGNKTPTCIKISISACAFFFCSRKMTPKWPKKHPSKSQPQKRPPVAYYHEPTSNSHTAAADRNAHKCAFFFFGQNYRKVD